MIALIVFIYIITAAFSTLFNSGKWIVNSTVWAIPLFPFMVIYYLISGDKTKRSEALIICKSSVLLAFIYIAFIFVIKLISL